MLGAGMASCQALQGAAEKLMSNPLPLPGCHTTATDARYSVARDAVVAVLKGALSGYTHSLKTTALRTVPHHKAE